MPWLLAIRGTSIRRVSPAWSLLISNRMNSASKSSTTGEISSLYINLMAIGELPLGRRLFQLYNLYQTKTFSPTPRLHWASVPQRRSVRTEVVWISCLVGSEGTVLRAEHRFYRQELTIQGQSGTKMHQLATMNIQNQRPTLVGIGGMSTRVLRCMPGLSSHRSTFTANI